MKMQRHRIEFAHKVDKELVMGGLSGKRAIPVIHEEPKALEIVTDWDQDQVENFLFLNDLRHNGLTTVPSEVTS
jgi:hypothetical protein